jgi:hypothetical protein
MQQRIKSALDDLNTAKRLSDENRQKAHQMVEGTNAKEFTATTVA